MRGNVKNETATRDQRLKEVDGIGEDYHDDDERKGRVFFKDVGESKTIRAETKRRGGEENEEMRRRSQHAIMTERESSKVAAKTRVNCQVKKESYLTRKPVPLI